MELFDVGKVVGEEGGERTRLVTRLGWEGRRVDAGLSRLEPRFVF